MKHTLEITWLTAALLCVAPSFAAQESGDFLTSVEQDLLEQGALQAAWLGQPVPLSQAACIAGKFRFPSTVSALTSREEAQALAVLNVCQAPKPGDANEKAERQLVHSAVQISQKRLALLLNAHAQVQACVTAKHESQSPRACAHKVAAAGTTPNR